VLDAQRARDLGGDHHIRVVGESMRPPSHRNPGLDQRGGHQAAVLAAGQAELDGLPGLAERRDRVDKSGCHFGGRSGAPRAWRRVGAVAAGGTAEHLDDRGP
jgi:hypothetical protein